LRKWTRFMNTGYEVYPVGVFILKLILAALATIIYIFYLRKKHGSKSFNIYSSMLLVVVATSSCCTTVPDTDRDGYADDIDQFPLDPTEWNDTDGDGYGNNIDKFPNKPTEWNDTDGDGHGDNNDAYPTNPYEWNKTYKTDIYPGGNGAIVLFISYFKGDNSNDEWSSRMDPYFISKVDYGNNGVWDFETDTMVMRDTELANNITVWSIDMNDAVETIRFNIEVRDLKSFGDYEIIDMNPHPEYYSMIHIIDAPFKKSWTFSGNDDSQENERDCTISYEIYTIDNETKHIINTGTSKNVTNINGHRIYHIEPLFLSIPVKYYAYAAILSVVGVMFFKMYFWKRMKQSGWSIRKHTTDVKILENNEYDDYIEEANYEVLPPDE